MNSYIYIFNSYTHTAAQWLSGSESTCNARHSGSIPESGRFSGDGNGNPLHYSCPGNTTDRGAWWAAVHGVAKELNTTEYTCLLYTHTHTHTHTHMHAHTGIPWLYGGFGSRPLQ